MERSTVMFAKAPVPGAVKTRLAATVGDELAARFHAAFIADVATTISSLPGRHVLAWAGDATHDGLEPLRAQGFDFVPQAGGDLGARLDAVLRAECARVESVVVVGSDSPTLMQRHLEDAFDRLRDADVVIGPSFDGGYYLLGVRAEWYLEHAPDGQLHPLFEEIPWSTRDVLEQTLRCCQQISSLCDLTAFWYDVDTFEDLKLLATHLLQFLLPSGEDLATHTAVLLADYFEENPVPTS